MKLKVAIIDDEPLAREYLRSLLEHEDDIEIVAECVDGAEAIEAIRNNSLDLVFLDIQMPGQSGIEVIETIGVDRMPLVTFVTAFDSYALEAFNHHALDYLLKPFDEELFYASLTRARRRLVEKTNADLSMKLERFMTSYRGQTGPVGMSEVESTDGYIQRIPVKTGTRVELVPVAQIDWIEAADYYVILHVGSKSHLIRETMQWLEAKLNPAQFVRIHRGSIVQLDRIKELRSKETGDYVVRLSSGEELNMSRRRKQDLEKALGRPF